MGFKHYVGNLNNEDIQRIFLSFENEFENTLKLGFGDSGVFELMGGLLLADYDIQFHDIIISLSKRVSNGELSPLQFSDKIDEIIYTIPYLPYEDWSAIYRHLKNTQTNWIQYKWQYSLNNTLSPLVNKIIMPQLPKDIPLPLYDEELKLVGVTFENRQAELAKLVTGDLLVLKREYNNNFGKNATMVYTLSNKHIGYISKEHSHIIAPYLDNGNSLYGIITKVFEGSDTINYGARFKLFA